MKRITISALVLIALVTSIIVNAQNKQVYDSFVRSINDENLSNLSLAFYRISTIPGFQLLTTSDIESRYSKDLGHVKSVVYGNAEPRPKVLGILKNIPAEFLYSEYRTENDKISRCYIETTPNGKVQMLYAFVGKGGNDLMVTLFSGASVDVYKKEGDALKSYTYEEMEQFIINTNAECPMIIGLNTEVASMSINRQYWTIRIKTDTFGNGLSKEFQGVQGIEKAKVLIKGFNKQHISSIFNLKVGLKVVITTDTGDSQTIILEYLELAEILQDTETTSEHAMDIYIENTKKSYPLDMQNGMILTDIKRYDGILYTLVSVDEEKFSMSTLESTKAIIKQTVISMIQNDQDLPTTQLAGWLVDTNNGMGYVYKGNKSNKIVTVVITCDELREVLNKK